ncbi:MAG: DUF4157 domain-containing protein [Candidatus Sulfotelmatobacter sp.]
MPNREFDPITGPVSGLLRSKEGQTEPVETSTAPVADRDPLDRVACRAGDSSCAKAHASTLNRATDSQPARATQSLLQLQRQYGNRYVERVLALARENAEHSEVAPTVEQSIQQERGGGQNLDHGVRHQMESSFGADFSGVRVHTDQQSDSLNRSLSARAFTTGQDIFFRQGAYQPGSSAGRELLAHELTHVVQQGGDQVRRAMSVSQPGDPHEVEAEQTARAVMEHEHSGLPGAGEKEKEEEKHAHHMMASRCPGDGAQRQPEAMEGKHKDEEEEKKKHHVMKKAAAGTFLGQAEQHGGSE